MDYNQDKESENKEQEELKNFVKATVEQMNTLRLPLQNEFMRSVSRIAIEQRTNKTKELDAESGEIKKSLEDLMHGIPQVSN